MIELTCTKCKTVLSIDDAFAGGVCRCKHCGTIQTVPKQTKRSAIPASVAANGRPDTVGQATGSGTGLDELAHVVASSGLGTGLGESRLRKSSPEGAAAVPQAPAGLKRETVLILSVGGTIVVLLGIIIAILLGGGGNDTENRKSVKPPVPVAQTPTGKQGATPHFMGMPIRSASVIYVLDRGSGTDEAFDPMRVALQNSLATLPPTTQFQVIFWETDSVVAVPSSRMQPATPENISAAHLAVGDVVAFGQSRVEPALSKAMAQNPTDVILASGKAGLDEAFVKSVIGLRQGRAARIHTFSLGSGSPEALRSIAQQTGGEFRELGIAELRRFAE